ncbi:MAG: ASKHA domain-containing protein [Dissulfuribacterales bacterium]
MTEHKVKFLPSGRIVLVEDGETVSQAARKAGVHINASCGGSGLCGKCRVLLESGTIEGGKSEKLTGQDYASGIRQACLSVIKSDLVIRIPQESVLDTGVLGTAVPVRHRAGMYVFDIGQLKKEGIFASPVDKLFLELPRPSPAYSIADAGRLIKGLADQYDENGMVVELQVLRRLRRILREDDFRVTVTLSRPVRRHHRTRVINIQAGNWTHRNFGLAVDIGTTTVYGQLLDLNTGQVLAEAGDYNAQMSYGEDVISRIIHAERAGGLELMQSLAVSTINGIIEKLLDSCKVSRDEISSITLAGNTTMTHLFLGLEPHNIRRSPYVPVSTFFPPIRARDDLGLDLGRHAVALVFPAISSYVGGDIVAGIMGSGMYRTDAQTLFIDVGTNAEIVIGNREWLACAACSAGPAFEGGGITHGMRASAGAIEDFSINPRTFEPMNITIGNKPPGGICGSGLLIIVATLFEHGVIDPRGKFNRDLRTPRIRQGKSGYEYVLAWKDEIRGESDIVINEADIDNFIRAKAAIYAGIMTLLGNVGLEVTDLEQVILAGAFGSYIDLDCAMTVGLLPDVVPEKVKYVGNGSLMGARMSGLSNHIRKDVVDVVHRMTSFELSEVDSFKDHYVASLFLPHTDISLFPSVKKRNIPQKCVT